MGGAWRLSLIPVLSLTGVVLDALGGLYLAYDLLGGRDGPLRTITKAVSYGVIFGIVYGLPLGVWFGLAGLLVSGPALSIEIRHRRSLAAHPFFEAMEFGLGRAVSFAAAGWLAKDAEFGIYFGIFTAIGLVTAYGIFGPPASTSLRHPRINKAGLSRAAFRGASIGLAAILAGVIHRESDALAYGVKVGVVTGLSSGILVAIAPTIEEWVDKLPDRRLGGYGAMLVLIGSILQTAQYLFPLVGVSR